MIYTIDIASINAGVDEETSRVADRVYTEEGVSLYDTIKIHSGDKAEIMRFINDAINTLVKRTWDIVTIKPSVTAGPQLEFKVPDLNDSNENVNAIKAELDEYIILNTCAAWFQHKAKDQVEEYALRGQTSLDKAVAMLKTRKAPTRIILAP